MRKKRLRSPFRFTHCLSLMENRREYPRIILLNVDIRFRTDNGELYEVVNASEGGLCLRRPGGERFMTGTPIRGRLNWPAKGIERDVSGRIVWSRLFEDGDAIYGMTADVDWLMTYIAPYQPEMGESDRSGGPEA